MLYKRNTFLDSVERSLSQKKNRQPIVNDEMKFDKDDRKIGFDEDRHSQPTEDDSKAVSMAVEKQSHDNTGLDDNNDVPSSL